MDDSHEWYFQIFVLQNSWQFWTGKEYDMVYFIQKILSFYIRQSTFGIYKSNENPTKYIDVFVKILGKWRMLIVCIFKISWLFTFLKVCWFLFPLSADFVYCLYFQSQLIVYFLKSLFTFKVSWGNEVTYFTFTLVEINLIFEYERIDVFVKILGKWRRK